MKYYILPIRPFHIFPFWCGVDPAVILNLQAFFTSWFICSQGFHIINNNNNREKFPNNTASPALIKHCHHSNSISSISNIHNSHHHFNNSKSSCPLTHFSKDHPLWWHPLLFLITSTIPSGTISIIQNSLTSLRSRDHDREQTRERNDPLSEYQVDRKKLDVI